MRRSTRTLAAAVAAAALVGACSPGGEEPAGTATLTSSPAAVTATDDAPTTDAPTGEPTATGSPATEQPSPSSTPDDDATAPAAPETEQPDLPFSTEAQQDPSWPTAGGDLLPTTVRVASHPGFERVVFDFAGTGTPGYRVEYVDAAVDDPKGTEVDLDGDAVLQVVASGTRYPAEGEAEQMALGEIDVEDDDIVAEVHVTGVFEGLNQAFLGLDAQRPFRVFTLTDPARLVVDVQAG
ncbi:hypothetical protein MF406_12930 [Georgenia sp. TF02-10]|uniref:AMIN-like domain-containing (lipo)protein n=1 Tax=Georgenia sp. TF02-10 TaxID=2917725 RepID=UPI001FA716BB|nr:hypothetical protein [Georgenia sp. TF02-10]UNX53872.1 hypothetical protein MF406_12930 [Georgenia sp. TF02-10]